MEDGADSGESPQEYDPHNYSNSFCNFADDLNGDGWTDLIVVDFPGKQTWWFEQPDKAGRPWKRHECTPVTNNESPSYLDVDGDGKRELVLGYDPGQFIGYAKPVGRRDLWKLMPSLRRSQRRQAPTGFRTASAWATSTATAATTCS